MPMKSFKNGEDKQDVSPGAPKPGAPVEKPKVSRSIAFAVLIFVLIAAVYILISGSVQDKKTLSLSELATGVTAGQVKDITVDGDSLTVTMMDDSVATAKKEVEASLSETLKNYGVPAEKVAATNITVKSQSGAGYWIMNLLPILLPLAAIVFFFWFLSRQSKGSGMQAFTFGQSKARMTDP